MTLQLACKKLTDEVLVSYLSGAKCRWSAYGPADATATQSSLAKVKSRMVLPFWYRLTQVAWKGPLNECLFSLWNCSNFVPICTVTGLSTVNKDIQSREQLTITEPDWQHLHAHTRTHTHTHTHTHKHIHNHFMALLDSVRDYPSQPAPER